MPLEHHKVHDNKHAGGTIKQYTGGGVHPTAATSHFFQRVASAAQEEHLVQP